MSWLEELEESDRIAAAEWIRDRDRLGACPSCGGPNDHGEECASIYPEIYGRGRACRCACHRTGPRSPSCRDCAGRHA